MSGQKVNVPMLGLFLGGVAAVSAGLLSMVHAMTEPQIETNKKAAISAAMAKVLPAHDNDPTKETHTITSSLGWDVTYFVARKEGHVVGYAGKVDNPDEGFSGAISLMVGLEPDGAVAQQQQGEQATSAVIVTGQTETPGLGTAVTDRKMQKTILDVLKGVGLPKGLIPNKYLDWYAGKKAGETRWTMIKEGESVNAKTGATITSRAVSGAIYAISKTAVEHLDTLAKGVE